MKRILIALMLCFALVMTVLTGCTGEENKPVENNVEETNGETTPAETEKETETPVEEKEDVSETVENTEAEEPSEETAKEPVEETEKSEEKAEESEETVAEEPKLDEDIATDPEKPEEVVNAVEFINVKLLSGIANAMGKATSEVTIEDIEAIAYLGISTEETGDYTVYIGMQDYLDAYNDGHDQAKLEELIKKSVVDFDESDSLEDLVKFKSLQTFELYDVPVADVSFIKELPALEYGFFKNNGITDVSALEGYNTDVLAILDFTDNDIADWTPLHHIKEKVIISFVQQEMTDANGEKVVIPMTFTLEDKIAQEEANAKTEEDTAEEPMMFVDENGEQVDFGSLFD